MFLKRTATPPPFLPLRHLFRKLKSEGNASFKIIVLLSSVSHVSVRNRKSRLEESIKSLIHNDLLFKDLIFNKAIFKTVTGGSGVALQGTASRLDLFSLWFLLCVGDPEVRFLF